MSGGSFNYLQYAEFDRNEDLRDMVKVLREELNEPILANLTELCIFDPSEHLRKIWRYVESWKSGDYSKEQVEEAIKDFPIGGH